MSERYLTSENKGSNMIDENYLSILDIDNGITLCKTCHESIKGREHACTERFTTIVANGGA